MSPKQYAVLQVANKLWTVIISITAPLWILPIAIIAVAAGGIKHFWWYFKLCLLYFRSIFNMPETVERIVLFMATLKKSGRWEA